MPLRLIFLLMCIFFPDFEPSMTTMAPKKTALAKRHHYGSTSRASPPPPDDLSHFISREAELLYHESLCIRSFVPERGLSTLNAFFNFTIQTQGWQTLCSPPTLGVAPIVCEFYSNLPFRVGTIVFVRGSGSTSGHGPSTSSISCGRTTVRSTKCYLWPPTLRA